MFCIELMNEVTVLMANSVSSWSNLNRFDNHSYNVQYTKKQYEFIDSAYIGSHSTVFFTFWKVILYTLQGKKFM